MTQRYRLFRRMNGMFFIEDCSRRRQESLRTKSKEEAQRLFHARNEAHQQPTINLHIARAYASTIEFGIASTMSMSIRATWEANRGTIYGGAIAAALGVAAYYGAATVNEWIQIQNAKSALEEAGTSIRNELTKAKDILNRLGRTLRNLKVVPMPRSVIPEVADHVSTAQSTHPMMLTRVSTHKPKPTDALSLRVWVPLAPARVGTNIRSHQADFRRCHSQVLRLCHRSKTGFKGELSPSATSWKRSMWATVSSSS